MSVRFCINNPKTLRRAALGHHSAQTREPFAKGRTL